MPWGRLDDSLYDHPKLDLLPVEDRLAGVGLWARAISWCNRFLTDGHVPRDRVTKLDGTIDLADQLVTAGLWEPASHGYQIHDFLEFNDSRAEVLERRQKDAERKAAWRKAKDAEKASGGSHSGTSRTKKPDVPRGVTPSVRPESRRQSRDSTRARAGANPDPTRPDPSSMNSPQPPASGGPSRSNGTSPRQVAKAEQDRVDGEAKQRRDRRSQRQLAYLRGALTEAQRVEMNERDAPLEEIPDYAEHQAKLRAEAEAASPLDAWTRTG